MDPVGEAILAYLRSGRPATDAREIFIRTRAPYRKLDKVYSLVRRRLRDAGVNPLGKCGPPSSVTLVRPSCCARLT